MDHTYSKGINTVRVNFANPNLQYQLHKKDIDRAIKKVLTSKSYVLGNEVKKFESEFSDYIGVKYSIGVANGTDAIEIALRALSIGQGDEVLTVSHTATATIAAIMASGANPVFVDINEKYFTLDHNYIKKLITKKTKALVLVHLYGQGAYINEIIKICKEKKIHLIEDVSQAHGAIYNNKRLGSYGVISCFSCYPSKNLGAIGDAGVIATNNLKLRNKMIKLREYGWDSKRKSLFVGRNSRLDELQAAILRVKLTYLDNDNKKRNEVAKRYLKFKGKCNIIFPEIFTNTEHVFHLFVIRTKKRSLLIKKLNEKNIFPGIHYPIPNHTQQAFKHLINKKSNLKITEKISSEILSLPIYPGLKNEEVKIICDIIKDF
mgnify:CR=1 FL=1